MQRDVDSISTICAMNVNNLLDSLRFIDDLDRRLGLQAKLEAIQGSLDNLVQSPAHPQHQSALANALAAFSEAATKLGEQIPPAQRALIAEIGGAEFFNPSIAETIKRTIADNAMTPSVARDFVQKLAAQRAAFLANVTATQQGIGRLGVQGEPLAAGSAEMAFLIPRDLFKNHLGTFAKELSFINQLILNFSEAITGQVEQVELNEISSSIPTVSIAATVGVMMAIGTIVNKFLDAWKKVEEIREIRGRLVKIGMRSKGTLDELTEEIKATVNQVAEESTQFLIGQSPVEDGRKNELRIAVKKDTLRLFAQIERGLAVEIRVEPSAPKTPMDDDSKTKLEELRVLSRNLQFPQIASEPILLASGDEEGVIDSPEKTEPKAASKKRHSKKANDPHEPVE